MGLTPRIRFQVLQRDGFTCQYCGRRPPAVRLHVDHIVPKSRGGSDNPDNLQAACTRCNHGKAAALVDGIATEVEDDPLRELSLALVHLLHAVAPASENPAFLMGRHANVVAGGAMYYAWGVVSEFGELPTNSEVRGMLADLADLLDMDAGEA